jgi:hypothetical protein
MLICNEHFVAVPRIHAKSMPREEILATTGSVHRNGKSISPEIVIKLAQQFSDEQLIAREPEGSSPDSGRSPQ